MGGEGDVANVAMADAIAVGWYSSGSLRGCGVFMLP